MADKNRQTMNKQFQRAMLLPTIDSGALALMAGNPVVRVCEPSKGNAVNESLWPSGMKELANQRTRIGGVFVNNVDLFFYAGTPWEFSDFLKDYSKQQGIEKHRLILHQGAGEAGLPAWGKRCPCDWELRGHPRTSPSVTGERSGYSLEIHFWTGGRISPSEIAIPENVEIYHAVSAQIESNNF
jgi:hypothetical protein